MKYLLRCLYLRCNKSQRCVPQPVWDASEHRKNGVDTWSGTPNLHLSSYSHHLTNKRYSSMEGTDMARSSTEANNGSSIITVENASWSCFWGQTVPERPCGRESAATPLQVEMEDKGTCLLHLRIWQSESLLGKPSQIWCLPAFQDNEPCWFAWGLISPSYWQFLGVDRERGEDHEVPADKGANYAVTNQLSW